MARSIFPTYNTHNGKQPFTRLMQTTLHAIATANPLFRLSQTEAAQFMTRVDGLPKALRRRIPSLYASSAIDYRYSCLEDYGRNPEDFQFYPQNSSLLPAPSTADRNRAYAKYATPLALNAAQQALTESPYAPQDITHLLVVSCTGFVSPGVEIELIQQLGLSSRIARTSIGFMGCHGALNGLKIGHDICQAHPRSRVLMVCVELCTLHFQIEDSIESVVTNALFSDGAAAVILSADSPLIDGKSLFYRSGESLILPDSRELMNWTIGDTGFLMGLSPQVPDRIGAGICGYVEEILGEQGLSQSQMDFWAIHPGGIEIVRQVQSALNLPSEKLQESYDVLRDYGNMSSPTILFILKRILDRLRQEDVEQPRSAASQLGSAMAFGPGLTIEFALFQIL
jgi:alpha-pyrone synthase